MAEDFYRYVAGQQLARLDAAKAQHLADLANARAQADYESAAQTVQEIANIEAAKQNLVALHDQYVASQTPQAPPEPSPEERLARPWQRMDATDIRDLARGSKYAKDIDWDDEGMRAGYNEALARRARGE